MSVFGYNTIETGSATIDDTIRGSHFTCPEEGTGDSISGYIKWYYDATKLKFALYKRSDASLVTNGVTEELTKSGSGYVTSWLTANFLVTPSLENIDYYIVGWANKYANLYNKWESDKGAMDSEPYNNFLNPWDQTLEDKLNCIYCTYTAGVPPPPIGGDIHLKHELLLTLALKRKRRFPLLKVHRF